MVADGKIVFFNEWGCDLGAPKPEDLEIKPGRGVNQAAKKVPIYHRYGQTRSINYMSEDQLDAKFGTSGWKHMPDAIARRYKFLPTKVEVEEHHIGGMPAKQLVI